MKFYPSFSASRVCIKEWSGHMRMLNGENVKDQNMRLTEGDNENTI